MIYLDYAANTPVDKEVLNNYMEITNKYIANPNSNHAIGIEARREIEKCSIDIANYFKCSGDGIIYTSGSSESNNLVIKGIASMYKDKGKHIIISSLEHSSIVAPCNYLVSLGYDVSVVSLDNDGNIVTEVEGAKGYTDLLNALDTILDDYVISDEDGNEVKTGEKRIYVPLVVFVRDGEIVDYHADTVSSQTDPYVALTNEEKNELINIYKEKINKITSNTCTDQGRC